MSVGDAKIHVIVTMASMNKLEPRSTPRPSWIPPGSPPSLALKLEKTSDAPAANAINVTPANDWES